MKRAIALLLLVLCAGMGCVTLPSLGQKPEPKPQLPRTAEAAKSDVKPDEINTDNAHQMAGALLNEMDAAQAQTVPAPAHR
jgi:hypothetical protein